MVSNGLSVGGLKEEQILFWVVISPKKNWWLQLDVSSEKAILVATAE